MNEGRLSSDLTGFIACALHYQERGEPNYSGMRAAEIEAMWMPVPETVRHRYLNEQKFHAQVDRAVAGVLMLISKAKLSDNS